MIIYIIYFHLHFLFKKNINILIYQFRFTSLFPIHIDMYLHIYIYIYRSVLLLDSHWLWVKESPCIVHIRNIEYRISDIDHRRSSFSQQLSI